MKAFCVSHSRDVDGISSAALFASATGGAFRLTDYDTLLADLKRVPADTERFVLCDMGVDGADEVPFLEALGALAVRCRVAYVDHHYLARRTERRIEELGVEFVHDESECASMLTYGLFKRDLPEDAWRVALLGAVTDGMDSSPMSSRLMERTDRLHVLAEASLLSKAVMASRRSPRFAYAVARGLSAMKEPHEIKGVEAAAFRQLRGTRALVDLVRAGARRVGGFAYVVVPEEAKGNVAELIPGVVGVEVGVSLTPVGGRFMVELRGTSRCRAHLGKVVSGAASKVGGSGGGHRLAAGGNIPRTQREPFLRELERSI